MRVFHSPTYIFQTLCVYSLSYFCLKIQFLTSPVSFREGKIEGKIGFLFQADICHQRCAIHLNKVHKTQEWKYDYIHAQLHLFRPSGWKRKKPGSPAEVNLILPNVPQVCCVTVWMDNQCGWKVASIIRFSGGFGLPRNTGHSRFQYFRVSLREIEKWLIFALESPGAHSFIQDSFLPIVLS